MEQKAKAKKQVDVTRLIQYMPIFLLVLLCVVFTAMTRGRFLSLGNVKTLLNQSLIVSILSTGAIFVFSTGNINTAMGGTSAVSAIIGIMAFHATGSYVLMILVMLAVAVGIMTATCLFSIYFKVNMMMMTLIVMNLLMACQKALLVGQSSAKVPYSFANDAQNANAPLIIFVIFYVICLLLFNGTALGRKLKFIGSSQNCANQTGIHYNRMLLVAFVIAGIAAGLGGLLTLMRSGSIGTTTNTAVNMDVMLAIVLAGMPVSGGAKSKISAAIIGSLLVSVLNSGLLMVGVSSTIIQAIRGICFIVIIALSIERTGRIPAREI